MKRLAYCAALVATLSLAPSIALADDDAHEDARVHYERGLVRYDAEDYPAALEEFQRSYDLSPTYRLLYYIGEAQARTGAFAKAATTLERYLEEGAADVPEKRRDDLRRELDALRARIARVAIVVDVEGAVVTLDGAPLGRSPLAARVYVDPGTVRVAASKPGFTPQTQQVTLHAGDVTSIQLQLPRLAEPPPPPAPRSPVPIIAWSTAGALTAGAIVSGVVGLAAVGRANDLKNAPIPGSPADAESRLADEQSTARTWFLVTDVLALAAVVTGGVALYFTLKNPSSPAPKTAWMR